MLRQYHPPRFRYEVIRNRVLAVGVVPVGTVFRSTDEWGRTRKLIVEAWLPREIAAWRQDRQGRWVSCYVANGGHLAQVRDLSNGRRKLFADHFIRFAVEHD